MSLVEKSDDEIRLIRAVTTLAGVGALLNHEIGAALLAIPVYLLAGYIGRIFPQRVILY